MKKINRRDYLKHMGIAAAGTVAAGGLNLFSANARALAGNSDNRLEVDKAPLLPSTSTALQPAPSWPWTTERPKDPNPGVRLFFIGMMVFTYKQNDNPAKKPEGRVAFHTESDHHRLKIIGFKRTAGSCEEEIFRREGNFKKAQMDIRIEDKPSNAKFYHLSDFDRTNDQSDPKDFGWLLDLEGPDFKYGRMKRTEEKYTSKIKVGQGTFYTYQHTYATFECEGSKCNQIKVGHVAKLMAADIPLSLGESVSFKIKGKKLPPLSYAEGVTYDIYFVNHCEGQHCEGDFHMVFDAVEIGANETFGLKLVGRGKDEEPPGLCLRLNQEKIFLNDEAPCMGGGFGSGGGYP